MVEATRKKGKKKRSPIHREELDLKEGGEHPVGFRELSSTCGHSPREP